MTSVSTLATPTPLPASLIDNGISTVDRDHKDVGTEFESVLISMLISNMRKSSFGEGLFPGDKSDTLGGMFDMMIAGQISETGGIGVRDLVNQGSREGRMQRTAEAVSRGIATYSGIPVTNQVASRHLFPFSPSFAC